jgi:hypothetical protein
VCILLVVLGLTAYELGRILGFVLIPAAFIWWGVVLRRRQNSWWWLPLVLGIVLGLGAIGAAVSDRVPADVRAVDPSSVFEPISGYEFVALGPEDQAQAEQAFASEAGERAEVEVRQVALPDGSVVGAVEGVAVDRDAMESEETLLRGVAEGAAEGAGVRATAGRLAGVDTYELSLTSGDLAGLNAIMWHPSGTNLVVMVFALPDHVRVIAERMIRTKV